MKAKYYKIELRWGLGTMAPMTSLCGSTRPYVESEVDDVNALVASAMTSGGLSLETDEGKAHIPQRLLQSALIIVSVWEEEL